MTHSYRSILLLSLWLSAASAACTSTTALESADVDPARLRALQARVTQSDSTDVAALRDLGILLMQQKRFDEAGPLLHRAYALDGDDPTLWFYYGLYREQAGHLDAASRLYARYRELPRRSDHRKMRRLLAGRYEVSSRRLARQVLQARLAAEDSLAPMLLDATAPPNTVAVFPLEFQGGDARYAPLGRGLSSLIMLDLGHVERLTVLERLRLQVLLDELKLAASDVIADGTAPRVGRLLSARRVIGGGYTVFDDERLRLDVAMREVIANEQEDLPTEDQLDRLFALEKDLVFRLLDEMGVEPSEAERKKIEFIPTRDLQALLAYSRGIQAEDAGRFGEAARHFQEAWSRDPGFEDAGDRAEINEGVQEAGSSIDDALAGAAVPSGGSQGDLLRERHKSLGENIGSLIVPGQDRRDEPPASNGVIGRPPAPPPRSGGN